MQTLRWLPCLGLLAACSPSNDDSAVPDARDAREATADGDGGACDPLLCASRCVAAGYATGICRDNGSCACSEPECDRVECDEACRALGFDQGTCRSTGACACSNGADGGGGGQTGERCGDSIDNDGDGLVDEDCGCVLGTHQPCYTGALYTRNIGECRDGLQRCESLDGVPHWGPCEGDRRPGGETCNGLDDDCDFLTDEGCGECVPNEFGAETRCADSQDNDCDGLADCFDPDCPPCCREEVCGDGIDNNCDDLVDEYCGVPCTPNEYFSLADCRDHLDNDCDGQTDCDDLDCIIACCTAELCTDGLDNDCDGVIDCADPDCGSTCCTVTENCGDGVDNDCDGQADCEDPQCCASAPCNVLPPCCPTCCVPGTVQRCYLPRYCSSYGWQTCKPDGTWGACVEGGP